VPAQDIREFDLRAWEGSVGAGHRQLRAAIPAA
jgi:hypothetical protein